MARHWRVPVRIVADVPLTRGQRVAMALEILADYVRVRWLLRTADFQTVVRRLRATPPAPGMEAIAPGTRKAEHIGARLGNVVWKTLRRVPTDSRCLVQALVLTAALARRGLHGELIIGVKSDPEFTAHAWIEHGGLPLLPHEEYTDTRLVEV
jgi:transglutaminase superfamily protein